MAEYTALLVGKAGVGGRVAELDNAQISGLEWELNGAGGFTISMPTHDPKTKLINLWKNEIQIWRGSTLEHWGVPVRRKGNPRTHEFQCAGLFAYFFRRVLKETKTYTGVDQFTIVSDLLNYAQNGAGQGSSFGIVDDTFSPSGILRDRLYLVDQHANVGALVQAFTELRDGIDFEIKLYADGARKFMPYYPSKGSVLSNPVLEWGRNIVEYTFDEDGVRMANDVISTGAGDGPARAEGSAEDATSIAEYLRLTDVINDSDITEIDTLNDRAADHVRVRKNPVRIPQITIQDTPGLSVVGVVKVGDRARFRISDGATQIDDIYRVVKINRDPTTEREVLTLNLP